MPSLEFPDNPGIPDAEVLYRRVWSGLWVWSESRPQSGAFDDSSDQSPMSVAIESLLTVASMVPRDLLTGWPAFGLVSFTAGLARDLGLRVTEAPPVAGEPAHGWVAGKKTRGIMKRLAKTCTVVIPPPPLVY